MEENRDHKKRLDLSRRTGKEFRHYQLTIKRVGNGCIEHHQLEVFAAGPAQLMDMRRLYCRMLEKTNFKKALRYARNN